jgi:hypothetical protein
LCALYARNPIAHKIAMAQKIAIVSLIVTLPLCRAGRLKAVEKLFMTICEKVFSAQQSFWCARVLLRTSLRVASWMHAGSSVARVFPTERVSHLSDVFEFECQTRICFQGCVL